MRSRKAKLKQSRAQTRELSLRGLFEAIEGFPKATDMPGKVRMNKCRRLLHKHLLLEVTMKKSILDIKLLARPTRGDGNGKHKANGGGLNHQAKSITVVNAGLLVEPLSHQSGFCSVPKSHRLVA